MRHGKRFNHLSRKTAHRKAMLANMACSLIEHKRINTTVAKAKALRQFVEPIITRSKDDSTHSRRVVFRYLRSKHAVSELFRNVAPAVSEREGGYTRIIKTGFRPGDSAEMCLIELVDFNSVYDLGNAKTKKRTRRGGAKKLEGTVVAEATAEAVVEEEVVTVEETKDAEATTEVAEEAVQEQVEETVEEVVEEAPVEEPAAEEPVAEEAPVEEPVADVSDEAKAESEEAVQEEAAPEATEEVVEEKEEEAAAEEPKADEGEEDSSDEDSDEEKKEE